MQKRLLIDVSVGAHYTVERESHQDLSLYFPRGGIGRHFSP